MTVRQELPPAERRRIGALWVGFLASLLAFAAQFQFIYAAAPWACDRGGVALLHAASAVALLVIAGSTWLSWRNYRRAGERQTSDQDEGESARARLLSSLGIMVGVLLGLATIAQWLAVVLLDPCPK